MTKQVGRNDPCPCGSGKKYKKCCELKQGVRKFNATVISSGTTQPDKASKISSSFFRRTDPTPPPEEHPTHPPEADHPM